MIGERHLIEAFDLGAEAFEIFGLSASCDGGQRAPVEGTFEGDDAVAFGFSGVRLEFAGHFDGAFQGFRARIGEKHRIGETGIRQALRQALLTGNSIEIGRMPQHSGLIFQRLHQCRMAMAEACHRNATAEIEIFFARCGE